MKTTIIHFTIYFTYIFLDKHYKVKANVLHKVGNYSSHMSRRDWNTFQGFTKQSYHREEEWIARSWEAENNFDNKTSSVWTEQSGSSVPLSFHRESTVVDAVSQPANIAEKGQEGSKFLGKM